MKKEIKNVLLPIELGLIIAIFLISYFIIKPLDYSEAERRYLAAEPEISIDNIMSGSYMKEFEAYTLDHFPLRDIFRTVKAASEKYIFQKSDINNYYEEGGYITKLDYEINKSSLDYAVSRFSYVNDRYLVENGITPYMVIVPDKSYYMKSALKLDYEGLYNYMKEKMDYAIFIDISNELSLQDYYYADTHWRQENIKKPADKILYELGAENLSDYSVNKLDLPFYGVYYYQYPLQAKIDEIKYVTSEAIEKCMVYNYDTGKALSTKVYNKEKAKSKDAYEYFLDGSSALIVIENELNKTGKELVIFRDSFGSSIAPYFIEGYSKIYLVDLRYISPSYLSSFIDFKDKEVLFIYSEILLNNSRGIK